MNRRKFIRKGSLLGLGFLGLKSYAHSFNDLSRKDWDIEGWKTHGYGPLEDDTEGILNLPQGFSYKIISRRGDKMTDGFYVPGLADGMATFKGANDKTIIIRNHEVSPGDIKNGAFGENLELIGRLSPDQFYDYSHGKRPCLGGTTTLIFNNKSQQVEQEWLSLAGTIRNCAGGATPWGSWITCEETTIKSNDFLQKDHGYNFEVPATSKVKLFDPVPLKAMGRFYHEAVCVDPRSGIVYQTEDRPDGLIYRFVPKTAGKLINGGKLQILSIRGHQSFDTRNWLNTRARRMRIGKQYQVRWLDIDNIEAPEDDLRYRGKDLGAAVFARGEGMWFGKNDVYFACTNGGRRGHGQIFRYIPSLYEGQDEEIVKPGTLEIFIEPNNSAILENCDNLTIATNGDLIICEDKRTPKIIGVTPKGKIFDVAKSIGYSSEFAGATFSPDGQTLFVNIQVPGLTIAINGPWGHRLYD